MKLLAISEHFFPRIGGTVNYVHQTLSELARLGITIELWVPGPEPTDWRPLGMAPPPYTIRWIDAGFPAKGDATRKQRYQFCHLANERALALAGTPRAPDLVHVMFGFFLMEVLNTASLRQARLPTVVTVHNVPPQECRMVSLDAPLFKRLKEAVRLQLVAWKNRRRLNAHRYDAVVVPSEQVRELLFSTLKDQTVQVIGHGPTADLQSSMAIPSTRRPIPGEPVRLLTAGGYAPHKCQHLIPHVAALLRTKGLAFEWDVVGPTGRIAGYFESVAASVELFGLTSQVRIHPAVTSGTLAKLYDSANLYLQPSIEEGFCITALDAAAVGLPVIASPAGALAQIAEASGGMVVPSDPAELSAAIVDFVSADRWGNPSAHSEAVRAKFSWENAAQKLQHKYSNAIKIYA